MMSVDPAGRVDMPIVVDAFMTDGAVRAPAGWHVFRVDGRVFACA